MAAIVPRTSDWKSTYALVVISPAMTTRPVAVRVSQATRLEVSSVRQASRMASEIWSAILSGWPSVTDSEVNKIRFFTVEVGGKILFSLENCFGLYLHLWRDPRASLAQGRQRHAVATVAPDNNDSKKANRRLRGAQWFWA